jgi:hypothetical protein
MHVRTTATELARWLEQQGGAWHVEGEPALAKSLPLPAPASSLVEVLRKRGGELAVLAPETTSFAEDDAVAAHQISSAAHVVDGQHVFQLAWVKDDGTVADSWLLAEQQPRSQRGDGGAAASNVVAAFRAARVTRG